MPSTTRSRRGDIVLVSFPFTDLSSSNRRPALVVSPDSFNQGMQDVMLAAITSQGVEDSVLTIEPSDCIDGILPNTSIVKPAKLFTMHTTLVLNKICTLGSEKLSVVLTEIRQFFA